MRRCLFISYVFPPSGGAGVQRVLKFVKYLPHWGWEAVVVTPKNPSAPLKDDSYLGDLPRDLKIQRLISLEPGPSTPEKDSSPNASTGPGLMKKLALNMLFPDRHVIWLATALPGTLAAARRHRAEVILVTGPPFSTFILGAVAARILGLPLVLDFRDDWSGFFTRGFEAHAGAGLWRTMVRKLEAALVAQAACVIGNTPEMTKRLSRVHQGPADKYVWIPNGYDPDDFRFLPPETVEAAPSLSPPHRLCLLYAGTVFESHPLTDLWEGLKLLTAEQRGRISVEVVGRVVPGQVADPGLSGLKVTVLPYEPHQAILRRMAAADVLVLTLADLPGLGRMVPAKLFEYMAVRRPVLCLAPLGAASKIVEACGAGAVVRPGRPRELADLLSRWLETTPAPSGPPPLFFSRRRLAGRLADALHQAAS